MSGLPPNIQSLLYGGGDWRLPGADDQVCEGAKFHSPRPLFVEVFPLVLASWWGGPVKPTLLLDAPSVWLCGTCRDNLYILLQMIGTTHGDLDWAVRREFGNDLRALAVRGWSWFAEHYPERARPADSAPAAS